MSKQIVTNPFVIILIILTEVALAAIFITGIYYGKDSVPMIVSMSSFIVFFSAIFCVPTEVKRNVKAGAKR